jgi:type II secretion system protein I
MTNHRQMQGGGFTLLEVMVAIAILGVALLALLGLHHQSLESVIRSQDTTQAVMLGQALMSEAELERFPPVGTNSGTFDKLFPGRYRNFSWQRLVTQSPIFPDIRIVKVLVLYGAGQRRQFTLTEYLHEPSVESPSGGAPGNGVAGVGPGGVNGPGGVGPGGFGPGGEAAGGGPSAPNGNGPRGPGHHHFGRPGGFGPGRGFGPGGGFGPGRGD